MSNVNTDGLPPEMQARIAEIIEKAKSKLFQNNTYTLYCNVVQLAVFTLQVEQVPIRQLL